MLAPRAVPPRSPPCLWACLCVALFSTIGGAADPPPLLLDPPLPEDVLAEPSPDAPPAAPAEDAVVAAVAPARPAPDGLDERALQELVDRAVEARLAGIPRPRYIPATDIAPPQGLLLLKTQPPRGELPFALALGGYMQLRWFEFARDATTWTDATGDTLPVNNINTFNINRFLLSFHGYVLDEQLVYNFALFGTTNAGIRSGVVPIGLLGWKFDEAATIGGGMTQVPGSREWLETTPYTTGVDRSMANTFFRPGFSPGVLAVGNFDKEVFYTAGVWNAIDGGTTGVLRRGTSMAWAGNTWWEPLGRFGLGASDMEHHSSPVVRFGCSGVYAPTYALPIVGNNPEDTIVRLSDGTRITKRGALGGDSRLDQFLYRLATVDAAWKYRGFGLFGEYYFRMLDDFQGQGPFDRSSIFDHGGMGYLSWCFVPRTYEAYARSSFVTGPYGTGQEYGGGLNWYLKESRQARLTLEALYMNRNPAQNILYPYRAGSTGTAIQTQFLVAF
ncbi:MAG: hypothetical protein RLZZ111_1835 [Planctomycetota bacterium]|jgi:hypothetical protein